MLFFLARTSLILLLVQSSMQFYKLRIVCTNVDQNLIADQRNFRAKYLRNDEEN